MHLLHHGHNNTHPPSTHVNTYIAIPDVPYRNRRRRLRKHLLETQQFHHHQELHEEHSFNYKEFLKSFIYEFLPPVFGAPLACLLLERNAKAAWHVMGHRQYIPSPHLPFVANVFLCVAAFPLHWYGTHVQRSGWSAYVLESVMIPITPGVAV